MRFSTRNPAHEVAPEGIVYVKTEQFHSKDRRDVRIPFMIDVPQRVGNTTSDFSTLDVYEVFFDGVRHVYLAAGTQEVTILTNHVSRTVSVPYFLAIAFDAISDNVVISGIVNGIPIKQMTDGDNFWDDLVRLFLQAAEEGEKNVL